MILLFLYICRIKELNSVCEDLQSQLGRKDEEIESLKKKLFSLVRNFLLYFV